MISRNIIEVVSDIPQKVNGTEILFTRTETWKVTKESLLDQERILKAQIEEYSAQLREVEDLLKILE